MIPKPFSYDSSIVQLDSRYKKETKPRWMIPALSAFILFAWFSMFWYLHYRPITRNDAAVVSIPFFIIIGIKVSKQIENRTRRCAKLFDSMHSVVCIVFNIVALRNLLVDFVSFYFLQSFLSFQTDANICSLCERLKIWRRLKMMNKKLKLHDEEQWGEV